jgi:hypothetical protein
MFFLYILTLLSLTLLTPLHFAVAGVVSHSLDWRKSAGGFIHGYRYTGMYLYWIAPAVLNCSL